MKINKKLIGIFVILIVLVSAVLVFKNNSSEDEFEVNTFLIKTVIKQGEIATHPVKITNIYEKENFIVSIEGEIKDLVSLAEKEFVLENGEEKNLELVFDNLGALPGVYVGTLLVQKGESKKEIPLILEIQTLESFVATNLNVAPAYKEILQGGEITVSVKIFNLKDTKVHTAETIYEIKTLEGEVITSEKESIVMESELVLSKIISLPEKVAMGSYVVSFTTEFEKSIATSSYLFEVVDEKRDSFEFMNLNILVIAILIFLVGILVLILYMIYERKTLLLQLNRQHSWEMSNSMQRLKEKRKQLIARASPVEKKKIKKKFKEIKKKVVKKIKEKHKKQKIEFKKLRKTHKKGKMETKLAEWKKEGFNVDEFLVSSKKIKETKGNDVKSLEKKGYDVSAIKK